MSHSTNCCFLSEYEQYYLNCLEARCPALEATLRGMGFPPQVAMDATQEAIAEGIQVIGAHEVEKLEDRWAWLVRVGVNKARTIYGRLLRGNRVESFNLDSVAVDLWHEEENETQPSALCEMVRTILDRLPAHLKELVGFCYLAGRSEEEATKEFGISRGAVKNRLRKVRNILRSELEKIPQFFAHRNLSIR